MKDEYLQTRFVTELADQSLPEKFYIVTAHNPFGGRATDTENEENNVRITRKRDSEWHARESKPLCWAKPSVRMPSTKSKITRCVLWIAKALREMIWLDPGLLCKLLPADGRASLLSFSSDH